MMFLHIANHYKRDSEIFDVLEIQSLEYFERKSKYESKRFVSTSKWI